MLQHRFQVRPASRRWTDRGPDLHRTRPRAIAAAMRALKPGNYWIAFRTPNMSDYSKPSGPFTRPELEKELRRWSKRSPVGGACRITRRDKRTGKHRPRLFVRHVAWDILSLTNATRACEVVIAGIRAAFPNASNLGWYNRRPIAGSKTWSQHAWGHAYDPGGSEDLVEDIGDWSIRMAEDGSLPELGKVIAGHTYAKADTGWRREHYSRSDHELHAHLECRPAFSGTPPLRLAW